MRKLITFCLWGNNPKYTIGAIKNAKLAISIYPDWTCRYYVGKSVPREIVGALEEFYHVEVVEDPMGWDDWRMMNLRFLPASEPDVSVMISRDCDSRLSTREAVAVQDWLESPFKINCLYDHPYHTASIMGGLCGFKRGLIVSPTIAELLKSYGGITNEWQTDQNFLRDIIYKRFSASMLRHSDFFPGCRPFLTKRNGLEFCGEIMDENDNPVQEHRNLLK